MNARLLALLALLVPAGAAATDLAVPSAIDEVTVHPSTAQVVRRARVRLPAGDVRLLLDALTPQLLDDSVRLNAGGSARARILGVSVERQPLPESTAPEVREAEEALRALELRDRALADALDAAAKQKEFLDALRATSAKEQSERLVGGRVDTDSWSKMVAFLGAQYEAVHERIREAQAARDRLQGELQAARERLDQVLAKGQRAFKRVAIDLHVERAGTADLELTYLVHGAGWQPRWDARLDPVKGLLDLGLQAEIHQRTGEDWSDVRLTVSSAEPRRQAHLPELHPLYLVRATPRHAPAPTAAPRKSAARLESEALPTADEDMAAGAFAPAPARMEVQLLSATWSAPDRASIPSTGERRRSFLASWKLDASLRRVAVPTLDPRAWITAKSKNDTGAPLLPGPVELFVEGAFVGRTQMTEIPEGGELELAFGADPRIRIERKVLDRTRDDHGVFSKRERITYRIRTTVKSHYREKVEVDLIDQLPVSRDEDIEVELLDVITAGWKEDPGKPGVRTWKVEVPAGGERVVEVGYRVSHPAGVRVPGLP